MPKLSATRKELLTTMMKEAIFEAATSVLCEHGVGGMTMDRVAAAAGLAKGSLYNYFRGKDDLLQFLRDRICQPLFLAIEEVAAAELSPPEKLYAVFREVAGHFGRHGGVIAVLLQNPGAHYLVESSRQDSREQVLRQLTLIFEQGIKLGYFRPLDPTQSARMLLACLGELFEIQVVAGETGQIEQVIEVMMSVFLFGVSAQRRAADSSGMCAVRSGTSEFTIPADEGL